MTLDSGQKTAHRSDYHRCQFFLSVSQPDILLTATLNDAGIARGDTSLDFNAGVSADPDRIGEGQTLAVVTTTGVQTVRIRQFSYAGSSPTLTGTIVIDDNSIDFHDQDSLFIYEAYDPRAIPPTFDSSTGVSTKRSQTYNGQGLQPPPLSRPGPHRQEWYEGTPVTLNLNGDGEAIAIGASITGWLWESNGGTIASPSSQNTTLELDTPGQYWVSLTVTDDNAQTHTGRRRVWFHDPDPESADYPYRDVQVKPITLTADGSGRFSITVNGVADDSAFLDGTLVGFWMEASYGSLAGPDVSPPPIAGAEGQLYTGYIVQGSIVKKPQHGTVAFEVATLPETMKSIPMQALSIHAELSPSYWFQVERRLTLKRMLHWLLYWHSNVLELADWYLPANALYKKLYKFNEGTLYSQVKELAAKLNNGRFGANGAGQCFVEEDINYLTAAERAAVEVESDLTAADWRGELTFVEQHQKQTAVVYVTGFFYDGASEVIPYCSIAPTKTRENRGGGKKTQDGLILADQDHANHLSGRYLAVDNLPVKEARVRFGGNYAVISPFPQKWWTMTLAAGDTPRGIVWSNQRLVPRTVTYYPDTRYGMLLVETVFEPEAEGPPGVYDPCPVPGDVVDQPQPLWKDARLSAVLAAGSIAYKPDGQNWQMIDLDDNLVYHARLDPFWHLKAGTSQPGQFRAWLAKSHIISYLAAGTETLLGPVTDPPDNWGGEPVTMADVSVRQVLPSRFDPDVCYGLLIWQYGGSWRSAVCMTGDAGATWSMVGLENATGQEVQGLWMAESLGSGVYLYATVWRNGDLRLQQWATSTLTLADEWSLGVVAAGELEIRQYWAFPVTWWNDPEVTDADDLVYVAGRVPGVKHIVKLDASGPTWTTLLDSWGDDYVIGLKLKEVAGELRWIAGRQNDGYSS